MARSSTIHRKLYIHPAHGTVGVAGNGFGMKPYGWRETWPPYPESAEPKRMVLVFRRLDANAQDRVALFEQALLGRCDARCVRVEFELIRAAGFPMATFSEADCVVWFGRGLQIARHWSDFGGLSQFSCQRKWNCPLNCEEIPFSDDSSADVQILASFPGHPVLDGVGSFIARQGLCRSAVIPEGATCLLTGQSAGESFPVAWACYGRRGRVFGTLLGSADDFRRPDFVRLVQNALDWIGGFRQ
jgi:hypothetical protein